MTVHSPTIDPNSAFPHWAIWLWLAVFALGGSAALVLNATAPARSAARNEGVQVVYRDHAVEKHKGEALAVRYACDHNGVYRRYRSRSPKDPNKFYEVCEMGDGRYGLRIVRAVCRAADTGQVVVEEVTSFIPGYESLKGTWRFTKAYVTKRATSFRRPLNSRFANLQLGVCK